MRSVRTSSALVEYLQVASRDRYDFMLLFQRLKNDRLILCIPDLDQPPYSLYNARLSPSSLAADGTAKSADIMR